jgi:hypothetical protein
MPIRRIAPTNRSAFLQLGTFNCITITFTSAAVRVVA